MSVSPMTSGRGVGCQRLSEAGEAFSLQGEEQPGGRAAETTVASQSESASVARFSFQPPADSAATDSGILCISPIGENNDDDGDDDDETTY